MSLAKRISVAILFVLFIFSAGAIGFLAVSAQSEYAQTEVKYHPFGEAAGMYMELTEYGTILRTETITLQGTAVTALGANVMYNKDAFGGVGGLHIIFNETKTVGDTVVIPSGATLEDGNGNGVAFAEETTLTLNGYGWVADTLGWSEPVSAHPTQVAQGDGSGMYLNLSADGGMEQTWDYTVGGTLLTALGAAEAKYVAELGGSLYLRFAQAVAADESITIPAGATLFDRSGKGIAMDDTYVLTYTGTAWTVAKEEVTEPKPEPDYTQTAVKTHPFGNTEGMYMELTEYGTIPRAETITLQGTAVAVLGASVFYNKDAFAGEGGLQILFNAAKTDGDTVVIPAGATLEDGNGNGVAFAEETTLTLNGYGWVADTLNWSEPVAAHPTQVAQGDGTAIYLKLSSDGGMEQTWAYAVSGTFLAALGAAEAKYVAELGGSLYLRFAETVDSDESITIPADATIYSVNGKGIVTDDTYVLTYTGTAWTVAKEGEEPEPVPEVPSIATATPSFSYGYSESDDVKLVDIEDFMAASGGYTLIGGAAQDADKNLVLENASGRNDFFPSILIKGKGDNGYIGGDYAVRFRSVYTYPADITWTEGFDEYPNDQGDPYLNPNDVALYFAVGIRGTTQNSVYISNDNEYIILFYYDKLINKCHVQFYPKGMTGSGNYAQTLTYDCTELGLENGDGFYVDFGCRTDTTAGGETRFTYFINVINAQDESKHIYGECVCVGEETVYLDSGWVRIYNMNRVVAQTLNVLGVQDGVGALELYVPEFTLTDEERVEKVDISEIAPVGSGVFYESGESILDIADFTKNTEFDLYLTFTGKIDATLALLAAETNLKSGYQIVLQADGIVLRTVASDGTVLQSTDKVLYAEKLDAAPQTGERLHLKIRIVEMFEGISPAGMYIAVYSSSKLITEGYLTDTNVATGSLLTGRTGEGCSVKVESYDNKNVQPVVTVLPNRTEITVGKVVRLDYENSMPVFGETVTYEIVGGTGKGSLAYNEELERWELTGTKGGTVEVRAKVVNAFGEYTSEAITVTVGSASGSGNTGNGGCSSSAGIGFAAACAAVLAACVFLFLRAGKNKN